MLSDIPIDVANLFGFAFSMLLYGAYFCIFAVTLQLLSKRTRRSRVVLCTIVGLFLTTTTTVVLSVIDNYHAWIRDRGGQGAIAYFSSTTNLIKVTKDLLLLLSALLADGLICWRLYAIWSRGFFVLVLPILLLLAEAAVGVLVVALEYHEAVYADGRFTELFNVGSVFICISSAAVNLIVTSLIVGKIWWVGRNLQDMSDRDRYQRIIMALIESGFLYTATIVVFFVCVVTKLEGVYILIDYILTVIVAIAPTLIILHLNYAGIHHDVYERKNDGARDSSIHFHSPSVVDEDDVSIMHINRSSPAYPSGPNAAPAPRSESPASPSAPYTASSTSPRSPSGNFPKYQVMLSPASSSSFSVNKSPRSAKLQTTRLRTTSSHASIPLGLGWSDASLSPIGPPEAWIQHIDHTTVLRESQGEDGNDDVIDVGAQDDRSDMDDGARLPPLPEPLPPSPTVPRRPSTYFSAVSDAERRSRLGGGSDIELTRMGGPPA